MTNQSTIDKLIEMRLTAMADAFRNQLNDPKFKDVPFEDRFGMLVDIEYSNRKNNRQKRLIHNAGFDQPEANIMDINYTSGRKLNRELINRLATCEYISEHRNLFITGATDAEQKDIFELLHRRRKKSSTIFCSQYCFEEWYDQLGGEASPLADAIIDRIAHDSYRINITSIDTAHDKSMREVYGLDKTLRE